MILGIDASNIRSGGGVTHLRELLNNGNPNHFGFEKVVVFSGAKTLKQLKDQDWLIKITHHLINKSLLQIVLWQLIFLKKMLRKNNCDLLICPAGTYIGRFRPYIAIAQNMLIFDQKESSRYGFTLSRFRFFILHIVQTYSLKNSFGVIFPSKHAKDFITKCTSTIAIPSNVIPHGISHRFINQPKVQREINTYIISHPFKLLYVSTVDVYKHQWNVVEAVAQLRKKGYPLELILIGANSFKPALKRLNQTIIKFDPSDDFVKYLGLVPYDKIEAYYKEADAFVLASTCESFGNILLEAMASGLPVACSNKSAMPEILRDAGFYFDSEDVKSIGAVIEEMINSPGKREENAKQAFEYSKKYSWVKCANETFRFIKEVADNYYIQK